MGGEITCATSGSTLLATGLRAARLSLRPMPDRQSSSLIFRGLTSIVCALLCDGFAGCKSSLLVCSRCSHAAKAEFFFTGDSERSRFAPEVGRGRFTKGSLEDVSYLLILALLHAELTLLDTVPVRLDADELSSSEFVDLTELKRSGELFTGE